MEMGMEMALGLAAALHYPLGGMQVLGDFFFPFFFFVAPKFCIYFCVCELAVFSAS